MIGRLKPGMVAGQARADLLKPYLKVIAARATNALNILAMSRKN